MNATIQPRLEQQTFTCATCGTRYDVRSAGPGQTLETCATCHPAYTGRDRAVTTGSRIERFERRLRRAAV